MRWRKRERKNMFSRLIKQRKTVTLHGRSIKEWVSDTPQENLWENLESVPVLRIYVSDDQGKSEQVIKNHKANKLHFAIPVGTFLHN